jgi:hypothetical protein
VPSYQQSMIGSAVDDRRRGKVESVGARTTYRTNPAESLAGGDLNWPGVNPSGDAVGSALSFGGTPRQKPTGGCPRIPAISSSRFISTRATSSAVSRSIATA